MHRLVAMQLEGAHRFVRDLERPLELRLDGQQPVVVVRVAVQPAEFAHLIHAAHQLPPDLGRIVDDHREAACSLGPERAADEVQDVLEIGRGLAWTGEHHREGLLPVCRIHEDAHQIEDLLRGARAAGIDDDAVREAHERLEALFDVRHDHELVDDRVRRLRRDDSRLRDAYVAPVLDALLRVPDSRALHRALHGARSAAGAHVQAPQPHLVPDVLRVLVLVRADGMAPPAHH